MHQIRTTALLTSTPGDSGTPTGVVTISLSAGTLYTVFVDGQPHVVLKPAIEALGLSYAAQYRKLRTRSWATVAQTATQMPGDDQLRTHTTVPVRTFLMLLANVNENRVATEIRPVLVAFQNETADAIEAHWAGDQPPRATGDELDIIEGLIRAIRDDRQRIATLERNQVAVSSKVAAIEGRHDWFTALGYARLHNHDTERTYLSRVGKKATAILRDVGKRPHRRQDATFGAINTYPTFALERAFAEVPR